MMTLGGIDNVYGTVSLTHCTLAGNQAATGGGIWSNSSLTFIDCIVASNTASSGLDISYHGGTVTPNGVNLIRDLSTSSLAASASVLVGAPLLANLGNYGGPTPTMPPLLGSPAIDAATTSSSATDQRGVPRPIAAASDIGAVEELVTAAQAPGYVGGTAATSLLPTVQWSGPAGATYELFIGPAGGSLSSLGQQSSPYTLTDPLLAGSNYSWRVDTTLGGITYPGTLQALTTRSWIEVTTAADEIDGMTIGGVSLREAIADAAPSGAAETIRFAPDLSGATCALGGSELLIDKSLRIDASSLAGGFTVSGNAASRVFNIVSGAVVELDSLTIMDGFTDAPDLDGAGLRNQEGNLTARNCTFSGNHSGGKGGAVYSDTNLSDLTTTLVNCTLTGNSASTSGGAIHNNDGQTVLTHCTITDNQAPAGAGSGVASYGDTVTETMYLGAYSRGIPRPMSI